MLVPFVEGLPLLVVLVGLTLARSRISGPISRVRLDAVLVVWCVVALLARQAMFVTIAHLAWRTSFVWGAIAGATLPAAVVLLVPSARWRALVAWLFVLAGTSIIVADTLYFAWFGDVFPAVAWLAVGQVGDVTGSVHQLLTGRDLWSFVDVVVAVPLVVAAWRRHDVEARRVRYAALAVAVSVAAVAVWRTAGPPNADYSIVMQRFSNLALVERIGPLAFHGLDSWLLIRRAAARGLVSDDTFDEVLAWLEERAPMRAGAGPWFRTAAGKNLIVIQVESLQKPVVHLHVNGRPVMPNLRKLAAEQLYFSQVIDQTDEGRTSDAEWLMLTSQFPAAQGAAAFLYSGNHLVAVPSVLAARGYQSLSAVAFSPGFWNRRVMHENFGFFRSLFAGDFAAGEPISWGLNDHDFLLQMTPRLVATRQPFVAWLITLSLHYPFDEFPDRHKSFDVTPWEGTTFGNHLHGMHYFDRALGDFLASLSSAGLLDSSLVVVTGDHAAGFRWEPGIAHALGFSNALAHWTMAERVPLVMRVPGARPEVVTRPVGQLDFAPTILGLLGVDASTLPYLGRNVLGHPGDEPVIRRKGSWVDDRHLFLLRGPAHGSHCYDRATLQDVPLSDCGSTSAAAVRQALMARRIQDLDLQQRLYARLIADAAVAER